MRSHLTTILTALWARSPLSGQVAISLCVTVVSECTCQAREALGNVPGALWSSCLASLRPLSQHLPQVQPWPRTCTAPAQQSLGLTHNCGNRAGTHRGSPPTPATSVRRWHLFSLLSPCWSTLDTNHWIGVCRP